MYEYIILCVVFLIFYAFKRRFRFILRFNSVSREFIFPLFVTKELCLYVLCQIIYLHFRVRGAEDKVFCCFCSYWTKGKWNCFFREKRNRIQIVLNIKYVSWLYVPFFDLLFIVKEKKIPDVYFYKIVIDVVVLCKKWGKF